MSETRYALALALWIALGIALLTALPNSVIASDASRAALVAASDRAAECDAALVHALPELRESYRDLCVRGYAIEGVSGRGDAQADACAETIMADLDNAMEGMSDSERAEYGLTPVPSPAWQDIVADCAARGSDAAYVMHVGPSLPPCAVEDASTGPVPCYWDAQKSGNGLGTSFIAVS